MSQSCKAFLAILLMIAMMLPVMVSCRKDTVEEETTAEIVTEAVTDPVPVPEEIGPQKIYLVSPKEASEQVLRLVNGAAALIEEKTKSAVEILTDTETAYEKKEDHFYVIFGETAYEQSKSLAASAQDNKMHYAATEDTVAVYAKTEQTEFEEIDTYEGVTDYLVSRIKRKKFKDIQLKFYSQTRFSLETVTLECFVGGYLKR